MPLGDGGGLVDVEAAVAHEDADHGRGHRLGHGVARHDHARSVVGVRAVALVDDGPAVHDDHRADALGRAAVEGRVGGGVDRGPVDTVGPGRLGPRLGRPGHADRLLGEVTEGAAGSRGRVVGGRARRRRRGRRLGVAGGAVATIVGTGDDATSDEQKGGRQPSTTTSPNRAHAGREMFGVFTGDGGGRSRHSASVTWSVDARRGRSPSIRGLAAPAPSPDHSQQSTRPPYGVRTLHGRAFRTMRAVSRSLPCIPERRPTSGLRARSTRENCG